MIRIGFPLLLALGLSACSSVSGNLGMFVEADLQNSIAINNAAGNAAGVACSSALLPVAMPSPSPAQDGIFTLIARKMAAQAALKSPACAPIVAQVLLDATHAVPILGNIAGGLGF